MTVTEIKLEIIRSMPNATIEQWNRAYSWVTSNYESDRIVSLDADDLAEEIAEQLPDDKVDSLADVEKKNISKALIASKGNRKMAASMLGISERTVYRKCKDYGLI